MVARVSTKSDPSAMVHLVIGDPSNDPDCPICRAHGPNPGFIPMEVILACPCPLCASLKEEKSE
jgi:hypothetical protein